MQRRKFETIIGGKKLLVELNDLALQANGSALLTMGETVVLVTATMSNHTQPNLPYFPLSVEFEEKFYAAGKILGGRFSRREGKPSEEAVLSARLIDRTIRPLFPKHIRNDIQIVTTVLALGNDDPDILGVIGASLALSISDIPWNGPVGAVRISRTTKTKKLALNATYEERAQGTDFEVVTCGQAGTINMIEAGASEIIEPDIIALLQASTHIHAQLVTWQNSIVSVAGKPKQYLPAPVNPDVLHTLYETTYQDKLSAALFSNIPGKAQIELLKNEFLAAVELTDNTVSPILAGDYFEDMIDRAIHHGALVNNKRPDGRDFDTLRPLFAEVGSISPVIHGSGIFYRGDTHVLSVATLAGSEAALTQETIEHLHGNKYFFHHYNFPPYSVGETGRVGGFNRRMIGHGALAEKALVPVLPERKDFPYTIRLVSETMSSNGSSSMASVCASSLAMMDAGIPIRRAVAGIASGVMISGSSYKILTDIQGPEDEYGDMDFKVAGTVQGITALQMDVKVAGVNIEILTTALEKARVARLHILAVMEKTIAEPRTAISPRAPKIVSLQIEPDQIGLVIGSGGKTINKIKEDTGVEEISIEDDGSVYITGKGSTTEIAAAIIRAMTRTYRVGEQITVTVTKITDFGAFAKLDDYHEGLIHISEIKETRVESLKGIISVGDTVQVLIIKIDNGKIGLSIKQNHRN